MPIDPSFSVPIGAVAGAAGGALVSEATKDGYRLAKQSGKRLLAGVLRRFKGPALEQGVKNTEQFDEILSEKLSRGADIAIEQGATVLDPAEAMADPDKFHALKAALYAAARTSSAERHSLLAEALAIRLRAASTDDKSVVATRAIEVLATLGASHLNALGLLALAFGIRSDAPQRRAELVAETERLTTELNGVYPRRQQRLGAPQTWPADEAREHQLEFESYYERMKPLEAELSELERRRAVEVIQRFRIHEDAWRTTEQDLMHLCAAGCVLMERAVFRGLPEQFAESEPLGRYSGFVRSIDSELRESSVLPLVECWNALLQHCTLTPVGFLIGLMVHDLKAGTSFSREWEWANLRPIDRRRDDWEGKTPSEITSAIVEAAKKSIADDIRRERLYRGIPN